jgi:hypothetical protein
MANTASNPYPPDGDSNGSSPNVKLSWTPGDNAAAINGHVLYFGADQAAVLNGHSSVRIGPQSGTSWAASHLNAGAAYYWRVDEVNPAIAPYHWAGAVWSFTVFNGAGLPAAYQNGYAAWCVDTMTNVKPADDIPASAPHRPTCALALARCEFQGFQIAIRPALGRRLDHIRLAIGDLSDGREKIHAAGNIGWQLVGLIAYGANADKTPDVLLPVSEFDVAPGNTHSLLVTVLAPAGSKAGKYTGTITIETDSGLNSTVNVSVTVYDFANPAANSVGCMHFRTTWTLNDLGSPAANRPYGDLLLSYRMSPDNIYWNPMPDIGNLEHWYERGITSFTVGRADNLWHPGDLHAPGGVDDFFTALRASPHGSALRKMAQFYGWDEKPETGPSGYGDAQGATGMRAVFGTFKAAYPDIPTTTTCHMYVPPWADPLCDMNHFHCDRIYAEVGSYTYSDGELLRGSIDRGLPNNQRFQYWAYGTGSFGLNHAFLNSRTYLWSMFQQKADGFLHYSVNGWPAGTVPIDPTDGPFTSYAIVSHSSGALIYPGTIGPLASMRMVNIRDGMQDWEYLWAIGHYGADGMTRFGKIASVETARELAEKISSNWTAVGDPAQVTSARDAIAGWLAQPYVSKYPTPEHRSTSIEASPTLTWQADSDDVSSFHVYFGTDGNAVLNAVPGSPEFKGNQTSREFIPPGPLAPTTSYYWRIDELVGHGGRGPGNARHPPHTYRGYVWSFKTV